MKAKSHLNSDSDAEHRRTAAKQEVSPARPAAVNTNVRTRLTTRSTAAANGKRNSTHGSAGSPAAAARTAPAASASISSATAAAGSPPVRTPATGPGRTPQTKRREFSLAHAEKSSPNGSPRGRELAHSKTQHVTRKPGHPKAGRPDPVTSSSSTTSHPSNQEESCRKSSNSSQDSGIGGRDMKPTSGRQQERTRSKQQQQSAPPPRTAPIITTTSPESVDIEVSNRAKFGELCDVKHVDMGIVRVPAELLNDLIHAGRIENYYDIDPVPVASGMFATVRKCKNKETGIEYAAKFSSRLRCGVDCTTEVLHEIALLSICAESSKIVHLKDVFQNKHEIVLVLEYAPGGDFQSVLDDDMVPFEQDVQGFIVQLLEALSYIHQRNIAHLDIKPQNIVLMSEFPNCEIKLCDLEVSRVIRDNEQIREIIGTPDYVAPEILGMDPISLAADIWSLGVLAYVLLTGFSPFGGDTDQETLRNITTAPLDFPAELFEGVSEDAKNFISQCLNRSAKKRPTVEECLQHPWISQNSEPPSPSPLMLKIPAPDHFVSPQPRSVIVDPSSSSDVSSSASSRRSCQTCRDKITERKRYLSKSREAIFEKVSNSNLKKSLSKSRERLCDMRLTLSKSRDYLNESKIASRHQEKLNGFKSLSKSQEVLSQALGGNMKRMVNGAVSDISPSHLPINPRVYLDSPDSCDFVILPGSSVLMSHSDLMSLSSTPSSTTSRSSDTNTLSVVPSTLATSTCVSFTHGLEGSSMAETSSSSTPTHPKTIVETLVEVSEDEIDDMESTQPEPPLPPKLDHVDHVMLRRERDSRSCEAFISESKVSRRKSSHELRTGPGAAMSAKEEKNNMNYETKQSMTRSASVDAINNGTTKNNNNAKTKTKLKARNETAEVAVQVNLSKTCSSLDMVRKDRPTKPADPSATTGTCSQGKTTSGESTHDRSRGNLRPGNDGQQLHQLRRGFSHDDTLGEEAKRYSWREELEKFRNMKKPLAVSDLIDTFSHKSSSRKVSSLDPSFCNIDALKNRRRGSLQLQINPNDLASLSERSGGGGSDSRDADNMLAKLQRRKSTSAILPVRSADVKMPDIAEHIGAVTDKLELEDRHSTKNSLETGQKAEKKDHEKEDQKENDVGDEKEQKREETEEEQVVDTIDAGQQANRGQAYLEKVHQRKRTWDYFEINHPKAISDKKLEQLKAKYTRRKTETALAQAQSRASTSGGAVDTALPASSATTLALPGDAPPPRKAAPSLASATHRTMSVPLIKGLNDVKQKNMDLAWDPITGESVNVETESVDSGKGGESSREPSICSTEDNLRKVSVNSSLEDQPKSPDNMIESDLNAARNKKNSLLNRLTACAGDDQLIPVEKVLQCFIDPFTGQFITSQVSRENGPDHLTPPRSAEPVLPVTTTGQAVDPATTQQSDEEWKQQRQTEPKLLTEDKICNWPADTSTQPKQPATTTVVAATTPAKAVATQPPSPPLTNPSYVSAGGTKTQHPPSDPVSSLEPPSDSIDSSSTNNSSINNNSNSINNNSSSINNNSSSINNNSNSINNNINNDEDEKKHLNRSEDIHLEQHVNTKEEQMAESVDNAISIATSNTTSPSLSNNRGKVGAAAAMKTGDSSRPRSSSGARERFQANKVCTGSFSRGVQRFRSESPAPAPTAAAAAASAATPALQRLRSESPAPSKTNKTKSGLQ